MPAVRKSIRQITEVLRQKWGLGFGDRQIARSCGLSRPTVAEYLRRAEAAGLLWPLSGELDDDELERKLLPRPTSIRAGMRLLPNWSLVHQELKRKRATLALLWDEYKAAQPVSFQYNCFCEHYQRWLDKLDVVMRQTHHAGEKMFVDYDGQTVPLWG